AAHHSFAQPVAFVSARAPRSGLRPTSVVLLNASMLETSRVEMTVSILRCRRQHQAECEVNGAFKNGSAACV
ncbi:MAG TPA: hypothetical protein VK137_07705, partial [Planctomycetaceae bacterium]|nr:hypothetical protein [Planctomycetaceae bacterium]